MKGKDKIDKAIHKIMPLIVEHNDMLILLYEGVGELEREIAILKEENKRLSWNQEYRKHEDEWGNTDWRDTGEMGG